MCCLGRRRRTVSQRWDSHQMNQELNVKSSILLGLVYLGVVRDLHPTCMFCILEYLRCTIYSRRSYLLACMLKNRDVRVDENVETLESFHTRGHIGRTGSAYRRKHDNHALSWLLDLKYCSTKPTFAKQRLCRIFPYFSFFSVFDCSRLLCMWVALVGFQGNALFIRVVFYRNVSLKPGRKLSNEN